MKFNIDEKYLLNCLERILAVPSPTGYYVKLNPVLKAMASELGYEVTYDNRSTAYITIEGEDNSKTVLVSAHADTIGMVVSGIDDSGRLQVKMIGGVNVIGAECSNVTVITRDGKEYTGIFYCKSHSTHAFDDARKLERSEENMMILLDEDVKSKEDVQELGIQNGDYVSFDPGFSYTEKGYIKSRFIDDKGGIASAFAMLNYLREKSLKPKFKTIIAFPYYEEKGAGGTYIPEGVSEFLAVDIGLVAPDLNGDERKVSICTADGVLPYDYDLTSRIIEYAKKAECDYTIDVFYGYGSDASAAFKAGNNLRHAAFGMAVYASHSVERTHIEGLKNTTNLLLAYILDI